MVSGLLQNACLRLEAEGSDVADIVSPRGIHKWLGRSGLAAGGAASLVVGAVLGGALSSVPILLPPPAVAAGAPQIVPSGGLPANTPWTLAASVLPSLPGSVPSPSAVVASITSSVPVVNAPAPIGGGGGSLPSPISNPLGGLPGSGGSGGGGGSGTLPTGGTTPPPPAGSSNPLGGVVTQVQGAVSQVTSTVTSTVNQVGTALGGATGGATGAASTGTTSSNPLAPVTSTVTGAVGTVTSSLNSTVSGLNLGL